MRAVIVGGGIAGLAAAVAVSRAGGTAVVLERHQQHADDVGSWLQVASNGMTALYELDLAAEFETVGVTTSRLRTRSRSGRITADMPLGLQSASGPSTRSMRRSDLYRQLRLAAERAGTELVTGAEVVEVGQTGQTATASIADGRTWSGDLLIGADGTRSRVRSVLHGAGGSSVGRMTLVNVGGLAAAGTAAAAAPVGTLQFTYGADIFIGDVGTPDGSRWWFANPRLDALPAGDHRTWAADRWRSSLAGLGSHTHIGELLNATETITTWPYFDRSRPVDWGARRIVLLGDAAHPVAPSSGQGASLALEDVAELALLLRSSTEMEVMPEHLARKRTARVRRIAQQGALLERSKSFGRLGSWARDSLLYPGTARHARRTGSTPVQWMYGYRRSTDSTS